MTHGPTERLGPCRVSGVARAWCSRTRTSTRVVSYGGGATIRQPFCWTPAASSCGQRQTEEPQRLQTSLPGLSQRKRRQRLYTQLLTAGPPSCFNPGPKDDVQRARATGSQGILGVVVSVGKVALVADGRRGGWMGGSLWPAFVMASWVAKGAQTTQSPPSHFW